MASVRGNTEATVESGFEPIETTGLRLKVLDSDGPAYGRGIEFEAYRE